MTRPLHLAGVTDLLDPKIRVAWRGLRGEGTVARVLLLGFVGVGRMGGPMAHRLLDAGYRLCVYDVSEEATGPLVARGAHHIADSYAAVAAFMDR